MIKVFFMRNTPGPAVWDCSGQVVQLKSNLIPIMAQAIPVLDQGCRNGIASFSPAGQGTSAC